MRITQPVFDAFLHCPTKAYLVACGEVGSSAQAEMAGIADNYHRDGVAEESGRSIATIDVENSRMVGHILAVRGQQRTKQRSAGYIPIRFIPEEEVTAMDRLSLAFDGLLLASREGANPSIGEVVHGREYAIARVSLSAQYPKVRSTLRSLERILDSPAAPPPILNKHCPECPYMGRCREIAEKADDLSLLARMSAAERQHYHQKGIFSVTQLSYTYRHRRRAKPRHEHALKALAIRKNQTHVTGKIEWNVSGTPVYIDVEGDPGGGFYYCIGLRFWINGELCERSYWANSPADECGIWRECVLALESIESATLIHFGSYESAFLRHMAERYPAAVSREFFDRLISTSVNLVSLIYSRVYFPTYSNGLKDIAGYLGFSWSDAAASGQLAVRWRQQWERSRDGAVKEKLLVYNAEDCAAAEVVAGAIAALAVPSSDAAAKSVDASTLKRHYPQRFGEVDFALPEFQRINDAAQWDYQRDRVHLRSHRLLGRRRTKSPTRSATRLDRIIDLRDDRPSVCRNCGSGEIKGWGCNKRVIHDLRMSRTGIRRWIVQYRLRRYICMACRKTVQKFIEPRGKYGHTLLSFVTYQVIELRLSQHSVARVLDQIFDLSLTGKTINRLKIDMAQKYEAVYQGILNRIVAGPLVHADETRARIIGKDVYVWAFANAEEVAFVLSESREASTPQKLLADFKGVLVSDFYSGYDSIPCPQQKCLVHLMRDINEDLCKNPFNEEMKLLARRLADLLRAIVDTVDRFGLKARHLRKHRAEVERFYEEMLSRDFQTKVAAGYQRRIEKTRDRLFTFLDYDGVPWNNNNAEHAIKAFVWLRNVIGGTSTFKGLREYLILLSISETCKNKGGRFLDFLLSQGSDIDSFISRRRRRIAVQPRDALLPDQEHSRGDLIR